MATTTNYSWTTPDDTALVKDGAAAIRSLGTAIDTTVFNNAGAAIAKTIVDAKGDIIAATAADTVARLAVGTDGQVLKANSATATGLEWATDASGMTNPMTTTGDTIYSSSGSTPARLAIGSTGQILTVSGGLPVWSSPASGGKVLQVVQGTSTTETTSTSQSFVDTGLSASITPSSTSSKILVIVSQVIMLNRSSTADIGCGHQLYRGTTAIYGGTSSTSQYFYSSAGGTTYYSTRLGMSYLDSPSTTSSTTYKTQMAANSGSTTVSAQPNSNTASIILLEIGA